MTWPFQSRSRQREVRAFRPVAPAAPGRRDGAAGALRWSDRVGPAESCTDEVRILKKNHNFFFAIENMTQKWNEMSQRSIPTWIKVNRRW